MRSLNSNLLGFLGLACRIVAESIIQCNETSHCPETYPCCTTEGLCGTGNYCMGGCDARYSFNLTACVPQPVCQSGKYELKSEDMELTDKYLGSTNDTLWTYTGNVLDYNGTVLLAMPENSTGTVVSSTFYVWYGKVSTRFKSSHNAGVVSSSILYSNVEDEIDVEFIGSALKQPESNFYYQGVLNYTNEANLSASNTYENWHTYEVDWKEENITWSIDGIQQRVLQKDDTYNATTKQFMFPQTPSRIQLSIWAGGDSSNSQGVIDWAGGEIDWDASDFDDPGYLYAAVDYIEVECYDPPSGTKINGNTSYIYTSKKNFTQSSIMITDNETILDNLGETGWDIANVGNSGVDENNGTSSSIKSNVSQSTSIHSKYSSSSLPAGYSTEFFQNINSLSSDLSSNAGAPQAIPHLGFIMWLILSSL